VSEDYLIEGAQDAARWLQALGYRAAPVQGRGVVYALSDDSAVSFARVGDILEVDGRGVVGRVPTVGS
jgi:hypothetical protein